MLDEKKLLEERRRRLEQSLHQHMEELKDRGRQAGKVALAGGAVLVGVWLVVKAVGSISARRDDHRRALNPKGRRSLGAIPPGSAAMDYDDDNDVAAFRSAPDQGFASEMPPRAQRGGGASATSFAAQSQRPVAAPVRQPSLFQTFIQSEAGKMMTNQLVALAMVFVTRKLEDLLKIDRGADIGTVKESDLTSYRIVDPVSDATVVDDDAPAARPNVRNSPPDASA
jgi:hypothetical protein